MKKSIFVFTIFGLLNSNISFSQFGGGTGSVDDPWLIETAEHLDNIRQYLGSNNADKYYKQIADIDLGIAPWNEGEGWDPIGYVDFSSLTRFYGNYNGNGFSVNGLYINRPATSGQGLFGYTMEAKIVNVHLKQVNITGEMYVGGLIGIAWYSSIIENCSSSGTIIGDTEVGGLIGSIYASTAIRNSFSNSDVSGRKNVGGILGWSFEASIIEKCGSAGSVSGIEATGGIVGSCTSNSEINNCYSTASVNGSDKTGGLAGTVSDNSSTSFSYGAGVVTGNQNTGGLVGLTENASIQQCFWDVESSLQAESAGGEGKTSAEMKNILTYLNSGWDFKGLGEKEIWNMHPQYNDNYPVLNCLYPDLDGRIDPVIPSSYIKYIEQLTETSLNIVSSITNKGIPTATQHGVCWNNSGLPTLSDNYSEQGIVYDAGDYSIIISDLESGTEYFFRSYIVNEEGISYSKDFSFLIAGQPEGDGTIDSPFMISSLADLLWISSHQEHWNKYFMQVEDIDASQTINWNEGEGWLPIGTSYYDPFTGHFEGNGHTISGIYINRPTINNQGLFGYIQNATIKNLNLNNLNITGYDNVGGLIGSSNNLNISGCSSIGIISGNLSIGGFIGSFGGSNESKIHITECFSSGSVSGNRWVGGFAGVPSYYSKFENCYSMSTVEGNEYVGGFVGRLQNSSSMNKCYSTGIVSGVSSVGGLLGARLTSTVSNSFWDIESSNQTASAGGSGITTALMKDQSTFTNSGWDFTNTWQIDSIINQGYPYLLKIYPDDIGNSKFATVSTTVITDITQTTATSGGEILFGGGTYVIQKGVVWSTTNNPTLNNNDGFTIDGNGVESFSSELTGLSDSTNYYVRAYATNSVGTSYGEELSFTTLILPPQSDFSAVMNSGFAPLEVSFIDSSSREPTTWYWEFGDGSTSTDQNPIHTYLLRGSYDVSLTTTNEGGNHTLKKDDFIIAIDQISIYDTVYINVYDTIDVIVHDTVDIFVYDTIDVFAYDTIEVFDTIYIEINDTVYCEGDYLVFDLNLETYYNSRGFSPIMIYPNPNTGDQLYIDFGDYTSTNDIEVLVVFFDINGIKYLEISNVDQIEEIDAKDLHEGSNVILIIDKKTEAVIDSRKIIIQ